MTLDLHFFQMEVASAEEPMLEEYTTLGFWRAGPTG
jgi:hypothetical protein